MSVSRAILPLSGATTGFFPASLSADLAKGERAIINSNVVVNLAEDYATGKTYPHLTVKHDGLGVLALQGFDYPAGSKVHVLTASPNSPVQLDPTSATFIGYVSRAKNLTSATGPTEIEIDFNGRPTT